jgi:hypothetical protein
VIKVATPTPTPTPTKTPTPTPTPTASPTASPTPAATSTPNPATSTSASPSPSPTNSSEISNIVPEVNRMTVADNNENSVTLFAEVKNVQSYELTVYDLKSIAKLKVFQIRFNKVEGNLINAKIENLKCGRENNYELLLNLHSLPNGQGLTKTVGTHQFFTKPCHSNPILEGAIEGESCQESGYRSLAALSLLECRYTKGKVLRWIEIQKFDDKIASNLSSTTDNCKLKGKTYGVNSSGFPMANLNDGINRIGTMKVLVVPIDFIDAPGDKNLDSILNSEIGTLKEWINYFSAGKLDFRVDSINRWIRAPELSKTYDNIEYGLDPNKVDSDESKMRKPGDVSYTIAQKFLDVISPEIDLRPYATVYILWPTTQHSIRTSLVPRQQEFKIKEGIHTLSFFAMSSFDSALKTPNWAFWIHETAHDWGLLGHAPGNGWGFGNLQNQSGATQVFSAWDQFLNGWLPDSQIYCSSKSNLNSAVIQLSPLEREDKLIKAAIISLSDTEALVIQSHGIDKWSLLHDYKRFPLGFYGIMAYRIDTMGIGNTQPVCNKAGCPTDNGNDPNFPRFAYYLEVDEGSSNEFQYGLFEQEYQEGLIRQEYKVRYQSDFVGVLGDSFTYAGIRISFIGTGVVETIRIEKID